MRLSRKVKRKQQTVEARKIVSGPTTCEVEFDCKSAYLSAGFSLENGNFKASTNPASSNFIFIGDKRWQVNEAGGDYKKFWEVYHNSYILQDKINCIYQFKNWDNAIVSISPQKFSNGPQLSNCYQKSEGVFCCNED